MLKNIFKGVTEITGHFSWWRSIVVRTSVLASGLSLSCARLMDGCLTTLWVWHPLSVNQPTSIKYQNQAEEEAQSTIQKAKGHC